MAQARQFPYHELDPLVGWQHSPYQSFRPNVRHATGGPDGQTKSRRPLQDETSKINSSANHQVIQEFGRRAFPIIELSWMESIASTLATAVGEIRFNATMRRAGIESKPKRLSGLRPRAPGRSEKVD
jgi:hypothetical protein